MRPEEDEEPLECCKACREESGGRGLNYLDLCADCNSIRLHSPKLFDWFFKILNARLPKDGGAA